jgi:hypothetical protein
MELQPDAPRHLQKGGVGERQSLWPRGRTHSLSIALR